MALKKSKSYLINLPLDLPSSSGECSKRDCFGSKEKPSAMKKRKQDMKSTLHVSIEELEELGFNQFKKNTE